MKAPCLSFSHWIFSCLWILILCHHITWHGNHTSQVESLDIEKMFCLNYRECAVLKLALLANSCYILPTHFIRAYQCSFLLGSPLNCHYRNHSLGDWFPHSHHSRQISMTWIHLLVYISGSLIFVWKRLNTFFWSILWPSFSLRFHEKITPSCSAFCDCYNISRMSYWTLGCGLSPQLLKRSSKGLVGAFPSCPPPPSNS